MSLNKVHLEIKCTKNADGTYDAQLYDNGGLVAGHFVADGDCDAIRELIKQTQTSYPGVRPINISGPCKDCLIDGDDDDEVQ